MAKDIVVICAAIIALTLSILSFQRQADDRLVYLLYAKHMQLEHVSARYAQLLRNQAHVQRVPDEHSSRVD